MSGLAKQLRARFVAGSKPVVRWGLGQLLPRTALRLAARRGDLQGRLIEATRTGDPFPVFETIRASGPMHKAKFAYITTSLPVVREVLSSNDFRTGFRPSDVSNPIARAFRWATTETQLGPLEPPSLLVTEPPDHTRYRKLVTRVFSVRAVDKLRDRAEEVANELLDALHGSGTVDLIEAYCTQLPVIMIAEILGVPLSERDRVLAFGEGAAPSLDLGLSWRQFRAVESSLAAFEQWLGEHLQNLRDGGGNDLLSQLVAAREDGVGLDDRELKATAGLVLAAGFETTVNLLGNGVALLESHPAQLRALLADPSGWPNAVDEILRFDPPVLLTGRSAIRATEVAGVRVSADSVVTTALAAANRDPNVFTDPNRFDSTRPNAKEHVSFSAGRHFCLGAALARMEGEVGLRVLFERYPEVQCLPGSRRRETRILRGYAQLPVRLGRSATLPMPVPAG